MRRGIIIVALATIAARHLGSWGVGRLITHLGLDAMRDPAVLDYIANEYDPYSQEASP